MKSANYTHTPTNMGTDGFGKWNEKPWKKTSSSYSTSSSKSYEKTHRKTKEQKWGGTSKTTSEFSREKLKVKNINRVSVAEEQTRMMQQTKLPMDMKISRSLSLPPECSAIADIADLILKKVCKKIIVMAGAGISTASGIPDFRTPGSGLYDNLQKYKVPYPEAIFDIDYFTYNPKPFFTLAKELYPGKYKPNVVHYFLRLLYEKGILLRCYTQNIDGLERMAGVPPKKLVEAHGTFASASCHLCYTPFSAKKTQDRIMNDITPRCNECYGVVKPDIVFFGEDLPKRFYRFSKDFPRADLLIVMGTSLEIEPFADIINSLRPNVPRLLINRDPVGPFKDYPLKDTDVVELGELPDVTKRFVRALKWQADLDKIIKSQDLVWNKSPKTSDSNLPTVTQDVH